MFVAVIQECNGILCVALASCNLASSLILLVFFFTSFTISWYFLYTMTKLFFLIIKMQTFTDLVAHIQRGSIRTIDIPAQSY